MQGIIVADVWITTSAKNGNKQALKILSENANTASRDRLFRNFCSLALGKCYLNGWGVQKDIDKAIRCINFACGYGDNRQFEYVEAKAYAAYCKDIGAFGYKSERRRIFDEYNNAKRLGSKTALFGLAKFFQRGKFVQKDIKEFERLAGEAAGLGCIDAISR